MRTAGIRATADDRVHKVLANPPIEQTGNIIAIGHHADWIHNVSIDYEIAAPRALPLGDLRLLDFGGPLKASTGSGSIQASGAPESSISARDPGDIRAHLHADVREGPHRQRNHPSAGRGRFLLYAHTGSGEVEVGRQANFGLEVRDGFQGLGHAEYRQRRFTLDASTGSGDVGGSAADHAWVARTPPRAACSSRRCASLPDAARSRRHDGPTPPLRRGTVASRIRPG